MNQPIVKTKNLNFSYAKGKSDIQDLNLLVPRGSIYGFLGPNGSGKTTTIRLLLGLLKKKSGEVQIFEKSFKDHRIECLTKVGALIETPSLYNHLNAVENLKIAARYRGINNSARIEEVLEIVKLSHAKKKKVKAFSLGMKQRLGLAVALLSEPELLILDEPTNGLDPKGIIEIRELMKDLNKEGITIFVSSHLLSEIEKTCSHVGIIQQGKMIYQDTVKALKASQSDACNILLETNNIKRCIETLHNIGYEAIPQSSNEEIVSVSVQKKENIPAIVSALNENNIDIYQVTIKNNLEDFFLTLTEN